MIEPDRPVLDVAKLVLDPRPDGGRVVDGLEAILENGDRRHGMHPPIEVESRAFAGGSRQRDKEAGK